ncbi:c-type cytochrome biogenesis protein CcmI [Histidinibacterium lentulum]|uniref:C-type cytochrome biogenesis protein CcmI n=1 Tax=Histidinibacterium lentulum TaxID=2480588 RepID=A0A3N2QY07_9RHOB|nr:c-type cytochrome biogenesis protein CcmI [Histidinibacterium lentulum]ROU00109.1 c-type cytochrome biogenesis protein CcmI [Histidinibacterium lentulum]
MIFFLVCGVAALLVTGLILLPLLRDSAGTEEPPEVALYRSQLEELDRDVDRGVIDADEAARARTEIARRLLAADRAERRASGSAPAWLTRAAAVVTGLAVVAVAGGLYWRLGAVDGTGPYADIPRAARIAASEEMRAARPGQLALEEASAGASLAAEDAPDDYMEMVERLREIVPGRPDDLEGWQLLARHEAALGNYPAARAAQERVIAIRGDEARLPDRERLLDLMVAATAGVVSPEAEELASRILVLDEDNLAARYYIGLLYAQTDRPDVAFRLWRAMIAEGPPENAHVRLARGQIEEAAFRAGEDYTLPPLDSRGPTEEQIAAAEDMDPEARAAMIENMVAGLETRLANEGGSAEDWARLISAKVVLGETDQARAILGEARQRFATRPEDLGTVEAAAERSGLE